MEFLFIGEDYYLSSLFLFYSRNFKFLTKILFVSSSYLLRTIFVSPSIVLRLVFEG
jgi:hypothetical protein